MFKRLIRAIHIGLIHISSLGKMNSKFYGRIVSTRAKYDSPENATGMKKEEFYKYASQQKKFALDVGLKPTHKVLEIGCGYLRLGEFIIRYLKKGGYYGCDISEGIIKFSLKKVKEKNLESKNPTIWNIKDLKFSNLKPNFFDFAFAHSVFTHIPLKDIDEIILAMSRLLKPGGCFYASFYTSDKYLVKKLFSDVSYHFPIKTIENMCNKYGLKIKIVPYPGNQTMIEIKKTK